jgi:NADPH:quinone reductase-like Zn-dependent oxidoreductase
MKMKAIVRDEYGPPDVLKLEDVDQPELTDDGVLVRVHAASLNRADWYELDISVIFRMGSGLRKPKTRAMGTDFAGTVEAVGKDVTGFRPGDEVFGGRSGSLAEYVCVRNAVALKPPNVTFEEAAAVPIAAITALQALRDKGRIQPGQKVLINGASGGVGTFAVQIAKAFGAEVTGVCSTRNVEIARSIGADHVIDYTKEDFTLSGELYDLMLDIEGINSWSEVRRVLKPHATLVLVGARLGKGALGALRHIVPLFLRGKMASQTVAFFIAKLNRPDLELLADLMKTGKMRSVIDRRYDLSEAAEAYRYMGEGHAQGKVVINI